MKRGEVWWVDFSGGRGGEVETTRPAVIVSNDLSNRHLNRVQVVPLTRSTRRVYSGETLVTFAGHDHRALANQLTTADKARVSNRAGELGASDLGKVELAIRVQLGLR